MQKRRSHTNSKGVLSMKWVKRPMTESYWYVRNKCLKLSRGDTLDSKIANGWFGAFPLVYSKVLIWSQGGCRAARKSFLYLGMIKIRRRGRREGGAWGKWAWTYGEHKILLSVCLQVWPYESLESESSGKHVSHRFPDPTPDLLNQTSASGAQGFRLLPCSPGVFCTLSLEC